VVTEGRAAERGVRRSLRGSQGRPRHEVVAAQRVRLLHAMLLVAGEDGYAAASVERVCARAGMSRKTVYELFKGRDELFALVLRAAIEETCAVTAAGYEAGGPSWPRRVRSGVVAGLALVERDPHLARVCVLESVAAGRAAREILRASVAPLVARIAEGGSGAVATAPDNIGPALLGSVQAIVGEHLDNRERGESDLADLARRITFLIVAPYRGAATARREAEAAAREMAGLAVERRTARRPFPELAGLALTDRRRRCLAAVAEGAAARSLAVAEVVGIAHPAQVYRILHHLEDAGLLTNVGARGAHEWAVTATGLAALKALERPAEPEWLLRAASASTR